MRILFVVVSLCCALLLSAPASAAPIVVVVSIPPQKYFVERVGGDAVAVTVMAAKGQDPHSYEPTAAQMTRIAEAELYYTIGVPFETQWMPKFHSLNPSMRVVDLLGAVPRIDGGPDLALRDITPHDHSGHDMDGTDDPHAWLSPDDMAKTVPLIVAALSEKRPDLAVTFAERGEALRTSLADLAARIQAMLDGAATNIFLTFHQSWRHYARNFALREACVELGGREPGPKSMTMLMEFAKANKIKVIVADSITGRSAVEAIAHTLNARVIYATPLAEDWPGALLEFSANLAHALSASE